MDSTAAAAQPTDAATASAQLKEDTTAASALLSCAQATVQRQQAAYAAAADGDHVAATMADTQVCFKVLWRRFKAEGAPVYSCLV